MSENGSEVAKRAAAAANRLRLVQADLADEQESVRLAHLRDEVDRALAGLGPEDREPFLKELMARFPVWESAAAPAPAAAAAKDPEAEAALAGLNDPSYLAERLTKLASSMPEAERAAIGAKLAAAFGVAGPAAPAAPAASGDEILKRFGKLVESESATLDPAKLAEAAEVLVKFASSLDQWVWNAWQGRLAPRSAVRRREMVVKSIAHYASGAPGVTIATVTGDVERLRQLILALISAVNQSGTLFAQRWLEKFSVAAIEQAAEPATVWEGKPVKCWKKYVELAGPLERSAIEKDIVEAVADYVDTLMRSR